MVRIRMKSFGRRHRPFFRICAMDARAPRDGRAIEELGHHDPMVRNTEARTVLNVDRIRYWLSVGAQPTEPVLAILKVTGDWQKFKGEPAPAPLLQPQEKAARPSFEALGGDDEGKGEAITQKKKAEKKDEAAAESSEAPEDRAACSKRRLSTS